MPSAPLDVVPAAGELRAATEAKAPGPAGGRSGRHTSLQALVSFEGQEDLLRGVELSVVLRGAGRIFKNSAGSAATYSCSRCVPKLDAFLSHNWSVSRIAKYSGLIFYYNFTTAVATTLVVSAVCGLISASGLVDAISVFDEKDTNFGGFYNGTLCRTCIFPVFLTALVFAGDLRKHLGSSLPMCFLDKCCVPQDDPEKMRAAIFKLAAFIACSDRMLVLYTNEYLRKIWTVYEVASFLILHPDKTMDIIPVYRILAFLFLVLSYSINNWLLFGSIVTGGPRWLHYLTGLLCAMICMAAVRTHLRHRMLLREHLRTFTIHNCTCTVEADRAVVHGSIITLMVDSGCASREADDDEVLLAFDRLARRKLPVAFHRELHHRSVFRLREYFWFGFVASGIHALDTLPNFTLYSHRRAFWCLNLDYLFWTVVGWPLLLAMGEKWSHFGLRLQGAMEYVLILILSLLGLGLPGAAVHQMTKAIRVRAETSDIALAGQLAVFAAGFGLLLAVVKLNPERSEPLDSALEGLDGASPRALEPAPAPELVGAAASEASSAASRSV